MADLPSREVLYAMMLSAMNGPVRSVASVLQGVVRKLVATVQAIADQGSGDQVATEQSSTENKEDD